MNRRRFLHHAALTAATLALRTSTLFAATPALVSTPLGRLQGETTIDNLRIFRGVPFAQTPVRFRPPVPLEPWTGTRLATAFAPAAPQTGELFAFHSEDCLYLNIYAPTGPGPFPVFVWIHGGGYTGGSSFAPIFDGSAFARNGIVCVTVAYRLGVFGFMDVSPLLGPAYADSANNALRDLIASLDWVHANISSFGGDPTRVTVGGQSAGAKITAALMAVPHSASLFQSAISESGGGERVLTPPQTLETSHRFGDLWRSTHPSSSPSFSDLLTAPVPSLLDTQEALIASSTIHFPFRSQIGGLLSARPTDMLATVNNTGHRLLIGTNRDESASFIGPHPATDPTAQDLGNLDVTRFSQVIPRYAQLYPDMSVTQRRIRATTAEEYWVPSVRLAEAHTRAGGETWMYRVDYEQPAGPFAHQAHHSVELGLVWNRLNPAEQSDPAAAPLSAAMHQAWVSFIQGKPPTAPGLPTWPRYNPTTRDTMIFAPTSHTEQNPNAAELQLWTNLL